MKSTTLMKNKSTLIKDSMYSLYRWTGKESINEFLHICICINLCKDRCTCIIISAYPRHYPLVSIMHMYHAPITTQMYMCTIKQSCRQIYMCTVNWSSILQLFQSKEKFEYSQNILLTVASNRTLTEQYYISNRMLYHSNRTMMKAETGNREKSTAMAGLTMLFMVECELWDSD